VNTYEDVKQIKLDDFLEKKGITKIDFIKIDVEGYELEVLEGLENTIKNSSNLWVFVEFSPKFMKKEKSLKLLNFFKQNFDEVYLAHKKKIFLASWDEVKTISFKVGQRNLFLYKN